jgi:hypothetical protein
MVLAEIATSLGSIKTALDILKRLKKAPASGSISTEIADLQSVLIEMQQGIMAANETHTADIGRIRDLEEEVANLKAWDGEKERYELQNVWAGSFVYALKPVAKPSETPHWLCAHCYQNRKKRILQIAYMGMTDNTWLCPDCSTKIMVLRDTLPQ